MSQSEKPLQTPQPCKRRSVDIAALEQRVLYSAAPLPADIAIVEEAGSSDVTTPDAPLVEDAGDDAAAADAGFVFAEQPALQPPAAVVDMTLENDLLQNSSSGFDLPQYEVPVNVAEAAVRHEIAFVDTGVEGYQTLIDDILSSASPQRQIEVVLLSGDGIAEISTALSNATDIDAVHLFSHGDNGVLHAGDVRLSSQNLHSYRSQIASWSSALSADADFLIYGCEMAGSTLGRSLLFSLSDLTGADVAASDNDTGNVASGGDWVLEFSAGAIETQSAIDAQRGAQWDGLLAGTGFVTTGETLVNEETDHKQSTKGDTEGVNKAIASNDDGDYVVVWTSDQQDGDKDGVYYRLYDNEGNARTGELLANQETNDDQEFGEVAMHDDGSFVITWTSKNQDGDKGGVYARMFNADGTAVSGEFQVNSETDGEQRASSIAMRGDGGFVITWEGEGPGNEDGIFARRYDAAGVALDAQEFLINSSSDADATNASVAAADNGNFVAVWESGTNIYYRRFAADGTALDAEDERINVTSSSNVSVAADAAGNFAVAYRSDSGFAGGVWVRRYNADGSNNGGAMKVSASSSTDHNSPSISMNDAGEFAVAYDGEDDGDNDGVFVRTYDASGDAQGVSVQVNETAASNQRHASVTIHDVDNYIVAWSGNGTGDSDGVFVRQQGTFVPNDPPVADAGGPYTIAEGEGVTFSATGSTDPDGDTLTYAWDLDDDGDFDDATGETVTLSWAQLQALNIDDNGAFDIAVEVTDGFFVDDAAAVLTVTNTGPTAVDDNGAGYNVGEDASFTTANVLANDTDPADTLAVTAVDTTGTVGSVTSNGDGTFSYDTNGQFEYLAAGQQATDTFVYTISDGDDGTAQATVTVTITGANDAVVASDDMVAVTEDTPRTITFASLFGNDTNVDGDTLTITSFTLPASGVLVDNGNNTFTYTPDADFNGADAFTYTVDDGNGNSDTATVNLNVAAVNDTPEANTDVVDTVQDTPVVFSAADLLANDTDADGHTLTIDSFTQPTNGAVTDNGNGTFTYTPGAGFTGLDSFTYTVTDGNGGTDTATVNANVGAVNNAPDARDDTVDGVEDTQLTFSRADLLANDIDPDGDTLTFDSYTLPATGSLVDNGDGTFTFTAPPDFNGPVTFTYTVDDGNGEQDTATVTINMAAVNDAPVTTDDTVNVTEDMPQTFTAASLLGNDSDADGDTLTISSFTQPGAGAVVDNGDGTFTFTPAANDNTARTFTYNADDGNGGVTTGTVTLSILAVNDDPVGGDDSFTTDEDVARTINKADLLANDTDADGDTLVISSFTQPANGAVVDNGATLTFTPDAGFSGTTSFTYTIDDGNGGSTTATVMLQVDSVNDAPVADPDSFSVNEDTTLVIPRTSLLGNDTDADGDTLSITSVTNPANGSLVDRGDGTFAYTPDNNFHGTDSFTYHIADGNGGVAQAVVTITVQPVDDAPSTGEDNVTASSAGPQIITAAQLLANDSDAEGAALTLVAVSTPGNGTAVLNSAGQIIYTPAEGFAGIDTFTYTVSDGVNTSTARVNVVVAALAPARSVEAEPEAETEEVEAEEVELETTEAPIVAAGSNAKGDDENQLSGPIRRQDEGGAAAGSGNAVIAIQAGSINGLDVAQVAAAARDEAAAALSNREFVKDVTGIGPVEIDGVEVYAGIGLLFDSPPPVTTQTQLDSQFGAVAAGSAAMFSVSFSVGYVLWTVRGGYLLSSMMAQMPAWRFVDPLPIIDYDEDPLEDEETTPQERDESLLNIIDNHNANAADTETAL